MDSIQELFNSKERREFGFWDSISARNAAEEVLSSQNGVKRYFGLLRLADQMSKYNPLSPYVPTINPFETYEKLSTDGHEDERRVVFYHVYLLYCKSVTEKLKNKNRLRRELSRV